MKKFWILLVVLNAWGQENTGIQNQNRILDLLQKQKEQQYIDEQIQYPDKYKDNTQGEVKDFEDNKEYIFKNISIESKLKVPKDVLKILKSYENKPLRKQDIFELIKKTSEYYIKKGYTTTLVTIKSGNIKMGRLILEVRLGYINKIEIKDSKYSQIKVFDAFVLKKNDIFNIYALDQGLENLNNAQYQYQMQVLPSQNLDYSDIVIQEYKNPSGISAGINNSSTLDKGTFRSMLGFAQDNLIGINDSLSLSYLERFVHHRNKNKESIYSINYSLPFKYWKFFYSGSYTDAYTNISANFGSYVNESKNIRNTFKLQRVIHRSKNSKTTAYVKIKLRGQKNSINGNLIEVNSKSYTALSAGVEYIDKVFGGNMYIDVEYSRGVPIFGGQKDNKNSIYKAEYNKINLNLSWQKYFYQNPYIALVYRLNAGGSYSNDELFYADKFFIGDQYTVRGFKESSLALDAGAYLSNTIALKPIYLQGSIWNIEPFFGFDYGGGRDYGLSHSDQIAGVAFGVNYFWKLLSLGVIISHPLLQSEDMPKEFLPIYFNLNIFI